MEWQEFIVKYVQRYLPTSWLRFGIRWYFKLFQGFRLRCSDVVVQQITLDRVERLKCPVTTEVEVTNEQLYANDPDFFLAHLGPKLKYSASEFPTSSTTLAEAEEYTIRIYQEKAGLDKLPSGARVLELGCGWGSLSLSNAERFPHLNFVSFSNSPPQIEYIRSTAAKRNITNLTVHVEDYAVFVQADKSQVAPVKQWAMPGSQLFDAAFAIETIEHAQNIRELLAAVAMRLKPGGKFFVHSLLHQSASFVMDADSWMGRNFYTGGSIISLNSYFHLAPPELYISECIPVSGIGYMKTALAWLDLQEKSRATLVAKYGSAFYEGFRMFYIAVAESFGANNGNEFMCGYYVFEKR